MTELPSGTLTFLFTDIEDSTRLWEQHPEQARLALARHDRLIEQLVSEHHGSVVRPRGEGDSRFAVFAEASAAVAAACAIQRAFLIELWPTPQPLRVRMALHTGEAEFREGDFYGRAVNRCARLRAVAHGGQTLLSGVTADLIREGLSDATALRDLGSHRLKDLAAPERVFQLLDPQLPADFPPLNSLSARRHNLPVQPSSFVGRERELAELQTLLGQQRLLTLAGVGGVGKTRLALELARCWAADDLGDVALVELAPLVEPAFVLSAVAAAVNTREQLHRPLLDTLADVLRSRHGLLLILDNCEHLIEPCAVLVDRLLRACPEVRVLATSREPLGIGGETVWRVPALTLPESEAAGTAEDLSRSAAISLFVERARAVQPDFCLTDQNGAAVADVCRRLDGMALAIELAAAWVRVLTPDQIASRLDDRFRLLAGGSRTAPARHQTLHAALDWSYALLTEAERRVFDRLSVFTGGWMLEAAESICAGDDVACPDVLDLLARLIDKSLVLAEATLDRGVRYRLLETVRQYGQERLAASGQVDAVRLVHARFFQAMAERLELRFDPQQLDDARRRFDRDHDNLRAALRWLISCGEVQDAQRLGAELARLWFTRGFLSEGRAWLAELLLLSSPNEEKGVRAKLLAGIGLLARAQGDYATAQASLLEALEQWREMGNAAETGHTLFSLGMVAQARGDHVAARVWLVDGVAVSRTAGNRVIEGLNLYSLAEVECHQGQYESARARALDAVAIFTSAGHSLGLGSALTVLGAANLYLGDRAAARDCFDQSLAIHRSSGDRWWIAYALDHLARLDIDEGYLTQAAECCHESLRIFWHLGDRQNVARGLEGLALIAAGQFQWERVLRLRAAAGALREDLGSPMAPPDELKLSRCQAEAELALGKPRAAEVLAQARAIPWAEIIESAPREQRTAIPSAPARSADPMSSLTARERDVVNLVAEGLSNQQIASKLVISERTVESHVSNVFGKLGLTSRARLAAWVVEQHPRPN